jgi:hypothetical protein
MNMTRWAEMALDALMMVLLLAMAVGVTLVYGLP